MRYRLYLPDFKKPSNLMRKAINDVKMLRRMYDSFQYNASNWCTVYYSDGKPTDWHACLGGALIVTSSNFRFPNKLVATGHMETEIRVFPDRFTNGYLLNVVEHLRCGNLTDAFNEWENGGSLEWPLNYVHTKEMERKLPEVREDKDTLDDAIKLCKYYAQKGI